VTELRRKQEIVHKPQVPHEDSSMTKRKNEVLGLRSLCTELTGWG
jgi:hypothetical protein